MKILILITATTLSGCASMGDLGRFAGAGSASYEYERTLSDGSTCKLSLLSGRDVIGAKLDIGPNCEVTSKADETKGVDKALSTLDNAIDLAKEMASKAP